jgi:hypothetical protein
MSGTNGTPDDRHVDAGTRLILGELRDLKVQLVDMRREAGEDRKRADAEFARYHREAAEDRKRHDADFARYHRELVAGNAGVTQLLEQVVEIVGGQQQALARIERNQQAHTAQLAGMTKVLGEIARALRAPRNGRGGRNGHNGGNGRKPK